MLLHDIAPSLNFKPADSQLAPTKRLTILLGAGASAYAGAPSTKKLTELVAERRVSGVILQALQNADPKGDFSFEDVFHAVEQLESLKNEWPERASASLRPFIKTLDSVGDIKLDRDVVRRERFELMETIAKAFSAISYDSAWVPLKDIFDVFLGEFNLDIFTLNYDLLADVAIEGLSRLSGKKWFNGFGSRVRGIDMPFDAGEYALWNPAWGVKYLTLQHLHGSLRYVYEAGDRYAHARRFVLKESEAWDEIIPNWQQFKELALKYPAESFCGISPIISGLRKLEKINVQPYANYYAAFAQCISQSPNLLILGYGKGDEHINYWIQEFAQIHNQTAKILEITNSNDPETFAAQRITEWDLHWEVFNGIPDMFRSAAGIENLTVTMGFTGDPALPARLREYGLPFLIGGFG